MIYRIRIQYKTLWNNRAVVKRRWFMRTVIVILKLFVTSLLLAQNGRTIYMIRSNGDNLALGISSVGNSSFSISAYGGVEVMTSAEGDYLSYIYQGHEYDAYLKLYYLPNRFYNDRTARFLMPDPMSQYHSSYLFVGADPINYVDRDGKQGKPLVLYSQEHDFPDGINRSMMDVMSEVPDAYYVPMSTFMNGEVGDLSEWNGNVYFKGHMEINSGGELEVERSVDPSLMKSRLNNVKRIKALGEEKYANITDAEGVGRSLRRLSEERGVPIKTIIAGGCQGGEAAERIGMGYAKAGGRTMGRTIETAGLHTSKGSVTSGKNVTTRVGEFDGLERTRFSVGPVDSELLDDIVTETFEEGTEKASFYEYFSRLKNGVEVDMKYVEGEEFSQMVNGRIPEKLDPDFLKFKFEY